MVECQESPLLGAYNTHTALNLHVNVCCDIFKDQSNLAIISYPFEAFDKLTRFLNSLNSRHSELMLTSNLKRYAQVKVCENAACDPNILQNVQLKIGWSNIKDQMYTVHIC